MNDLVIEKKDKKRTGVQTANVDPTSFHQVDMVCSNKLFNSLSYKYELMEF